MQVKMQSILPLPGSTRLTLRKIMFHPTTITPYRPYRPSWPEMIVSRMTRLFYAIHNLKFLYKVCWGVVVTVPLLHRPLCDRFSPKVIHTCFMVPIAAISISHLIISFPIVFRTDMIWRASISPHKRFNMRMHIKYSCVASSTRISTDGHSLDLTTFGC